MIKRAMVVLCSVGIVGIAVVLFLSHSDRSWVAAVHWIAFYTMSLGVPFWRAYRIDRALRATDARLPSELRNAPAHFVMTAIGTTMLAIGLIRAAAR